MLEFKLLTFNAASSSIQQYFNLVSSSTLNYHTHFREQVLKNLTWALHQPAAEYFFDICHIHFLAAPTFEPMTLAVLCQNYQLTLQ